MLLATASALWLVLSASPEPLTVDDAVRIALEHAPEVAAARATVSAAQAEVDVARSAYLPDVNVAAVATAGFGGSVSSSLGVRGIMGSPYTQQLGAGIEGSWVVYDFGRRADRVDNSQAGVARASALGEEKRRASGLAAIDAFLNAAQAQLKTAHSAAVLEVRRSGAEQARSLAAAGLRPVFEADLAQARAASAEAALELASGDERAARDVLGAVLGEPQTETTSLAVKAPLDTELTEIVASRAALPEEPRRQIARAAADQADAMERAAWAAHWPKLVVGASAGYARHDREPGLWAAGVGIVAPVFAYERERAEAEAAKQRARSEAALARGAELSQRAATQAEQARVAAALRAREAARRAMETARDGVQIAEARYSAGQLTFVEVDEARLQRLDAQLVLDEVALRLLGARARWRIWTGR